MDLKGILGDLLTLEVSTIIKDRMTAHKMPALPFALHDIIHGYADVLVEYGVDLEPYFEGGDDALWVALLELAEQPDGKGPAAKKLVDAAERAYETANGEAATTPEARRDLFNYLTDLWPVLEQDALAQPRERFSMAEVGNGWDAFERLRIAANQALDLREFERPEAVMLERIVGSCSRLKFIVQGVQRQGKHSDAWAKLIPKTRNELLIGDLHGAGVPLGTLRPEHQAAIRKIWELGTEMIVAQTSIQVDGDVLTRLSPALLEEHNEIVRTLIMTAHRESIDTSLRYWKLLADVAEKLVRGLLGKRIGS